ncbi:type VII secretion protein EccB [Streptomyces sp. S465]|uniref:type VII secretion protein EccB n=1 Tax=Streptomyces sp. S465 TaxID=2979468 RepID=UPI0022A8C53C|nr:type VII secretion protein EccB [Streptomyces sp. S465]WAP58639.1 type VII secretion protein EccB [Streptomyces sp. S465]
MASRRDELNAYTFAKKRMVASFVQPSPTVMDDGAPRPLRAFLPGVVVAALILAGFGAWGMIRPTAPKGWDDTASHIIVGSDSTTRYVILKTGGKKQLHPVLNLASAKLLLDQNKSDIIRVKESQLDNGDIPRGPTIGIPYAPDRMPSASEAVKQKRWVVCEQPGGGQDKTAQKAVFVLADREASKVEGPERLRGGQVLYVEGDSGRYLVDRSGTKYLLGGPKGEKSMSAGQYNLLLRTLFSEGAKPQRVTDDWLDTLKDGAPVVFPQVPGEPNTSAGIDSLPDKANRVGMVLQAQTGGGVQHYVVVPGKVQPVSDFTAKLLLNSEQLSGLNQLSKPMQVNPQDFVSDSTVFAGDTTWPAEPPRQVNSAEGGSGARDTVCNILTKVADNGTPTLETWAGRDYPATIVDGATSAYVTPGTGLFYRQFQGRATSTGQVFLVTDTGLRYQVQANNDGSSGKSKIGADGSGSAAQQDAQSGGQTSANQAQVRLGYGDVKPLPVPLNWSQFLPIGPRLDTNSARQPQGS